MCFKSLSISDCCICILKNWTLNAGLTNFYDSIYHFDLLPMFTVYHGLNDAKHGLMFFNTNLQEVISLCRSVQLYLSTDLTSPLLSLTLSIKATYRCLTAISFDLLRKELQQSTSRQPELIPTYYKV